MEGGAEGTGYRRVMVNGGRRARTVNQELRGISVQNMVTSAKTTSFVQRLQTPKTNFIYSMEGVLFIIILLDVDTDLNILESVICYTT